jgi:hypothetical protein
MEREVALALVCAGLFNLAIVEEARGRLSEAHIPLLLARVLEQSRRCCLDAPVSPPLPPPPHTHSLASATPPLFCAAVACIDALVTPFSTWWSRWLLWGLVPLCDDQG